MKNFRRFVFVVAVGASSLAAVGCGGSVEQTSPQTQASAVSKAPVAPQSHGVVKVFGDALGEVALRPDQRSELEQLAVAADTRHSAMAAGRKDLMLSVADQIEKGSIDRAALQPKIDRIVADLEKSRPDDHAALARMHAILDPDQRNAFVDALESRFKNAKHSFGHHNAGPTAEKAKGETEAVQAPAPGEAGPLAGIHAMKQLADDLKLTDDQRSKIHDALKAGHEGRAGFKEMHARMKEGKNLLESFRSDKFDPATSAPPPEKMRERAAAGSARVIGIAEKVLPILTPEQRKIAADKLRGMANAGIEMPFAH
jgi:Spy/CpxP family protein refolding chaperone